jgi:hypothetical protein
VDAVPRPRWLAEVGAFNATVGFERLTCVGPLVTAKRWMPSLSPQLAMRDHREQLRGGEPKAVESYIRCFADATALGKIHLHVPSCWYHCLLS